MRLQRQTLRHSAGIKKQVFQPSVGSALIDKCTQVYPPYRTPVLTHHLIFPICQAVKQWFICFTVSLPGKKHVSLNNNPKKQPYISEKYDNLVYIYFFYISMQELQ